jgi:hypothetical protein
MDTAALCAPPCEQHGVYEAASLCRYFGISRATFERRKHQLPRGFQIGKRTFWHLPTVVEHLKRTSVALGSEPDRVA